MIVKILTLGRVRGEAIWDMVMLLCAALVLFKFHGSMGVHSVCVVILLAAMISRKYLLKDYWSMITTLSLWGVMLWKPHIGFLLGILPVVFHGHKFFNVITFCCLTSYFLEFFPVGPVLYILLGVGVFLVA